LFLNNKNLGSCVPLKT